MLVTFSSAQVRPPSSTLMAARPGKALLSRRCFHLCLLPPVFSSLQGKELHVYSRSSRSLLSFGSVRIKLTKHFPNNFFIRSLKLKKFLLCWVLFFIQSLSYFLFLLFKPYLFNLLNFKNLSLSFLKSEL